jgi:hypothetical protein
MDGRVVKATGLRSVGEIFVGSNPTPCTSELLNNTSEVKNCLIQAYIIVCVLAAEYKHVFQHVDFDHHL